MGRERSRTRNGFEQTVRRSRSRKRRAGRQGLGETIADRSRRPVENRGFALRNDYGLTAWGMLVIPNRADEEGSLKRSMRSPPEERSSGPSRTGVVFAAQDDAAAC